MARFSVRFAWYDLWVGAFWDRKRWVLYVCPLPCLLITVKFVHPALRTPEIKAAHLAAGAEMVGHRHYGLNGCAGPFTECRDPDHWSPTPPPQNAHYSPEGS